MRIPILGKYWCWKIEEFKLCCLGSRALQLARNIVSEEIECCELCFFSLNMFRIEFSVSLYLIVPQLHTSGLQEQR